MDCLRSKSCCSYEYSPETKMCNLNKECEATERKESDFLFCKKVSANSTSNKFDPAKPTQPTSNKFDPLKPTRPTRLNRSQKKVVLSDDEKWKLELN